MTTAPNAGFSLLELIVVLALAGLLVALAFPNLQGIYGSAARNTERDRVLDQVAALGREAMTHRQSYFVADADRADNGLGDAADGYFAPYVVAVPEGWRLRVDEPVLVRASGVCLGGEVTLLHEEAAPFTAKLEAPFCRVRPRAGKANAAL